jgi:glucose/arabinose dehydrogenase
VRLASVGTFDTPVYVTAPPRERRRVFVVEQGGKIRVLRGGKVRPAPFLDLTSRVTSGGEQGLLSMAFAPDYAKTRRFYVNYTDRAGVQRVVEYRRSKSNAERADTSSARLVLRYDGIESNHNGGLVAFGPDDLLYIGTGDGGGADDQHGSRGNAQDLSKLEGKLLRIDPRRSGGRPYSVPASNPFVNRSGARPEIYSYGLRNPWRFSFDRTTGDLAIGDVGQGEIEEIDHVPSTLPAGVNFGWRRFEGTRRFDDLPVPEGLVPPVAEYSHAEGGCSVTGGVVIRDGGPLDGRYIYGDYCSGKLWTLNADGSPGAPQEVTTTLGGPLQGLTSFGADAKGNVLLVVADGRILRLGAR